MEMLQLSAFTLDGLFLEPDKSTYLLIHIMLLSFHKLTTMQARSTYRNYTFN